MSDDGGEDVEEASNTEEGAEGDDRYTEVTTEDFGDRLQASCGGICIGLLLFFGAFPLLFWNESRAVERYDALNEAQSEVTSITGLNIDPANEGKLLHFSVNVTNAGDALVDPIFGIETDGLVLRRRAEMYQWEERTQTTSKKDLGGSKTTTKTYTYEKEWKDYLVDSQNFMRPKNHTNPSFMEFEGATFSADPIMIGAYELPRDLVGRINWDSPLNVDVDAITSETIRNRTVKNGSDGFYFGNSNTALGPQVGDARVSFSETKASIITIVGVQNGNTLSAFVSDTGEGGDVLLFNEGAYSAEAMFEAAESENQAVTWIIRFVGYLVMSLGCYLVFRPIEVFADLIPCVGSIIGCGIIFMSCLFSAILSAITIAIAWLVAHPQIGAIILVVILSVVGCCAYGVKQLEKRRSDDDDDGGSSSPVSFSDEKVGADSVPTIHAIQESEVVMVPASIAAEEPTVYSTPTPGMVPGSIAADEPTVYSTPVWNELKQEYT